MLPPSCSAVTQAGLGPHCTHREWAGLSCPHPSAHLQKRLTLGSMAQAAGSSTGFWLAGVQGSSLEEDNRHTGWALVPAGTSLCGTLRKKSGTPCWALAPKCSSPTVAPLAVGHQQQPSEWALQLPSVETCQGTESTLQLQGPLSHPNS